MDIRQRKAAFIICIRTALIWILVSGQPRQRLWKVCEMRQGENISHVSVAELMRIDGNYIILRIMAVHIIAVSPAAG